MTDPARAPLQVLIVEARFYDALADALLAGARAVLDQAGVETRVVPVPGALEIPAAVAMAEASGARFDGYVAVGWVIGGETWHFVVVSYESARGLLELAARGALAIGNGILTVESEAQAWARARPAEGDKGGGAARACLAMIEARRTLAAAKTRAAP